MMLRGGGGAVPSRHVDTGGCGASITPTGARLLHGRVRRRFIPFSGGPRKCVGDQFALMEAVVALALLLKRFDVAMVPNQDPGMTTGATIHTVNGLYVTVSERSAVPAAAATAAA